MLTPCIDDFVRLTQDIPELSLYRDSVGVIRSTWFSPSIVYEVEFRQFGNDCPARVLLMAQQVELAGERFSLVVP